MGEVDPRSAEAIRTRMNVRLADLRLGMDELAARTGDEYRSVQRWLREGTKPPAEFLARFCAATATSADWLLLERGAPEAVAPGDAEARYRRIRDIVLEEVRAADAAELARIAAAELLRKDWEEAQQEGSPPSIEKRHHPRRRRGA